MAARSCDIHLCDCPGVDSPITNISAEAPDPLLFWGQIWNPYNPWRPPPLGNGLDVKVDCDVFNEIFSVYDPVVYASTQLMANLQALAASLGCPWPPSGEETFTNDAQTASVYCPDGTMFSYTVDAGTMTSPPMDAELGAAWVLWANAWAEAYAYQQASALLSCIEEDETTDDLPPDGGGPGDDPPIPPTPPAGGGGMLPDVLWTCLGEGVYRVYTMSGSASSSYTISLVEGSLPPGTALVPIDGRRISLTGVPTTAGGYAFKIRAVSTTSPTVAGEVWIAVYIFGLTTSTLTSAEVNVPYNYVLQSSGGTAPYTYELDPGSTLPDGLLLDGDGSVTGTAGTIYGTPTTDGDFTFDVIITDANEGECTQTISLGVVLACIPDTNCNAPIQAPCVFPVSITFTDWNSKKLEIIAPTADPAGVQPEWDGTLPVADDVNFPGIVRWYPAGTAWPVVVDLSFNGLQGFPGGIRLDVSTGSWRIVLYGYVGGVPTLMWEGTKTAGVTPEGTYMRTAGLSAGPDCMHATTSTTSSAMAWWAMEAVPLAVVDSVCGLVFDGITALPFVSIVAGHVNNALRIRSTAFDSPNSNYTGLGIVPSSGSITICGWFNIVHTVLHANNEARLIFDFYSGGVFHRVQAVSTGALNWIADLDGVGLINKGFAAGWHFLALTYNSTTGTLGFDVDQSGMTTAAVAALPIDNSALTMLSEGPETVHALADMIQDVDELAIYDGILTTAQLDCIYNAGAGRTW